MNILIIDIVGVIGTPLFKCFLVERDVFIGVDSGVSRRNSATTLFANQGSFRFNEPSLSRVISCKGKALHWVMYFVSLLDHQQYLAQGSPKAWLGDFSEEQRKDVWRSAGASADGKLLGQCQFYQCTELL
ncbi:hypothetical protein [Deinococcus marmoris]|uniref:hypothetical protein n=1 Tax=Deinococcus marmoris TaxID=249408 RepID=UPI00111539CD|nr:hypothetical protein [Deinococcus marmoris]